MHFIFNKNIKNTKISTQLFHYIAHYILCFFLDAKLIHLIHHPYMKMTP
ncbi:hypothetical protein BMW23_1072 [Bodo saltans virus]|uniref:Uncharacterized protein n=1 Tax=Bodo saltans virus TaxID=2024608 RepID=A0A2H4UW62_9VIRU|nr:hypothetical protein QJ851_gp1053 [Bodo saltans virus]ATZ81116.1 hypothetical protein BMW23_1072 [Bodo saltans virus]